MSSFMACIHAADTGLDTTTVYKITLLRVIPTMASIRFVTGQSSGILSEHLAYLLAFYLAFYLA